MVVTEVTHTGLGSRLTESIKGILFGILLFIVAFPLLFWNEGRAVDTAKAIAMGVKSVVPVSAESVDKANEGKLVHMTDKAVTEETLSDGTFGVSATAIWLNRNVEMFQWEEDVDEKREKKLGGGEKVTKTYSYKKKWSSSLINSSGFKESGHDNPGSMPYKSNDIHAKVVDIGAFTLSDGLVSKMKGFDDPLPVNDQSLAKVQESERANLKVTDGMFYRGEGSPAAAQIGDVRIKFSKVDPQTVSLLARQVGSSFTAHSFEGLDKTILRLQAGTHTAEAMFDKMATENTILTWGLRFGGFIMMVIGLSLIARPLVVVADIVPILGSLMGAGVFLFAALLSFGLSFITISIAWLFYRPLIGLPLLIVGVGAIVLLAMKAKKSRPVVAEQ